MYTYTKFCVYSEHHHPPAVNITSITTTETAPSVHCDDLFLIHQSNASNAKLYQIDFLSFSSPIFLLWSLSAAEAPTEVHVSQICSSGSKSKSEVASCFTNSFIAYSSSVFLALVTKHSKFAMRVFLWRIEAVPSAIVTNHQHTASLTWILFFHCLYHSCLLKKW